MKFKAMRRVCGDAMRALRRRLGRAGQVARTAGRDELLTMGERELCDIAIGRGEIPYLLGEGAAPVAGNRD